MNFRKNFDLRNIKTKLISILYGSVCHIIFVISGMCMFWVLYNGFTVSLGSVRQPLSIVINIFLLLQFPILHSFLLTNSGRRVLRFFAPRNYRNQLLDHLSYRAPAKMGVVKIDQVLENGAGDKTDAPLADPGNADEHTSSNKMKLLSDEKAK